MSPELHEQARDSYGSEARPERPVTVGSPTEYAEAVEVPEAIGALAQIVAGVGIAFPAVVVIVVVLGSCMICALVAIAAGWSVF
jgi:hypothetical protein